MEAEPEDGKGGQEGNEESVRKGTEHDLDDVEFELGWEQWEWLEMKGCTDDG